MERADGRIRGGAGLARPRAPARSSVRTTAAENGYVSAGPPASAAASPALSGRQLVCSRCDKCLRGRRLPELDLPTAVHACAVQHRAHAVLHRVPWSALARGGASQVLLRFAPSVATRTDRDCSPTVRAVEETWSCMAGKVTLYVSDDDLWRRARSERTGRALQRRPPILREWLEAPRRERPAAVPAGTRAPAAAGCRCARSSSREQGAASASVPQAAVGPSPGSRLISVVASVPTGCPHRCRVTATRPRFRTAAQSLPVRSASNRRFRCHLRGSWTASRNRCAR